MIVNKQLIFLLLKKCCLDYLYHFAGVDLNNRKPKKNKFLPMKYVVAFLPVKSVNRLFPMLAACTHFIIRVMVLEFTYKSKKLHFHLKSSNDLIFVLLLYQTFKLSMDDFLLICL